MYARILLLRVFILRPEIAVRVLVSGRLTNIDWTEAEQFRKQQISESARNIFTHVSKHSLLIASKR